MNLSPVGRELLWLYLTEPSFVGSVRDFSMFLNRDESDVLAALDELAELRCVRVDRDEANPGASAVVFVDVDPDRRRALEGLLGTDRAAAALTAGRPPFGYSSELIGRDPRMLEIYAMIDRVSRTNATVLLLGESGVGKDVVARTIHAQSARAGRPFTIIDCAAIPAALLESVLFGHERGSFTSALRKQLGRFEEADGGTVFLDEVADLPLDLQVKLLRVLQTRQFVRVGGTTPITIDVRFMAATNRALADMVRTRGFREDLYYRLNVVSITVPSLRERFGDISLLAQRIIASVSQRNAISPRALSPEALARLRAYQWPGNVRELENVLERALIAARGSTVTPEDLSLPMEPGGGAQEPSTPLKSLREIEIEHIRRILAVTGGNESRTARILGIHRDTLYRKLRRYRIAVDAQTTTPEPS